MKTDHEGLPSAPSVATLCGTSTFAPVTTVTNAAMNSCPEAKPRSCAPDCLCHLWATDADVVPYKGEDSPTDKELVDAWLLGDCQTSLVWWVGRLKGDGRYLKVMESVKSAYPEVDLEGIVGEFVKSVYEERPQIERPLGLFTKTLWRAAFRDLGLHRQSRVHYADLTDYVVVDTEGGTLDIERRKQLEGCFDKLAAKSRDILHALYWEQKPKDEVAALCEIKRDSFNRKLSRIHDALLNCLDDPSE